MVAASKAGAAALALGTLCLVAAWQLRGVDEPGAVESAAAEMREDLASASFLAYAGELQKLERGKQLGTAQFGASKFYVVEFEIAVDAYKPYWRNILHVGNSDGERSPGVWVYPNSARLHFRQSTQHSGNDGRDPLSQVSTDGRYPTKVVMAGYPDRVDYYYDGLKVGSDVSDPRLAAGVVKVFASDPWSQSDSMRVRNLRLRISDKAIALNLPAQPAVYDFKAAGALKRGARLGTLQFGERKFFKLEFDITVTATRPYWRNIFHVGDTNGQRYPGVWVYPNSRQLHFRMGTEHGWNDGNDPKAQVAAGKATTVTVLGSPTEVRYLFDGKAVGGDDSNPKLPPWPVAVYASDPWHQSDSMVVSKLRFTLQKTAFAAPKPPAPPKAPAAPKGSVISFYTGEKKQMAKSGRPIGVVNFAGRTQYTLQFEICLLGRSQLWRNIFHVGNTNWQRSPGVWIYPHSGRLHFRQGTEHHFNDGNDPGFEIVGCSTGRMSKIAMKATPAGVHYFLDGKSQGGDDSDVRLPKGDLRVWAADPWHASDGYLIRNLVFAVSA